MTNHYFFVLNTSLFALLVINLTVKTAVYVKFQKVSDPLKFFYSLETANTSNVLSIQPVTIWRKRQNALTMVALINSITLLFFSVLGILSAS